MRNFTAPNDERRCIADIRLRDGSGARCMRYRKIGGFCKQHARIAGNGNRVKALTSPGTKR